MYKPLEPLKKFEPLKPFTPLKPFEPIRPFEPLKPFEPPKSFELAKQIESTKTSQQTTEPAPQSIVTTTTTTAETRVAEGITKTTTQNSTNIADKSELTSKPTIETNVYSIQHEEMPGGLPLGYEPVVALEPLDLNAFIAQPPLESLKQRNKETTPKAEIEEGKAKSSLKEIISEIDCFAEKDKDLKDTINDTRTIKPDYKKVSLRHFV